MQDHLLADKLTLHVKIDDESQIFSDYAYNGDNLSEELSSYLYEKAKHAYPLPPKENFTIKIHTPNPNLRRAEITKCIHRHFHNEYDEEKRKLRYNARFTLVLSLLGLLALVLYFFADLYIGNFFLNEILDVAAWVFIWGAIEVFFLERQGIKRNCAIFRRLAFAEVIITGDTKMESPVYI